MSELHQPHKVPDAIPQTDAERAAAQAIVTGNQTSADRRNGWRKPVAMALIGAGALASVVVGVKAMGGDSDPTQGRAEQSTSSTELGVTIDAMEAMTPAEFGALPVEDQVNWVAAEANKAWNVEDEYDNRVLGALLGKESINGGTIDTYSPFYDYLTADAEAYQIIGQGIYFEQIAGFRGGEDGQKLISGQTLPGSSAYDYYYEIATNNPNGTELGIKAPDQHAALGYRKVEDYVAANGNTYPQVKIVEQSTDNLILSKTYVFVESSTLQDLTDQDGVGFWLETDFEAQ